MKKLKTFEYFERTFQDDDDARFQDNNDQDQSKEYDKSALMHHLFIAIERSKGSTSKLSPEDISKILRDVADSKIPSMNRHEIFDEIDKNWKKARR